MVFGKTQNDGTTNGTTSKKPFRKLTDFQEFAESQERLDELNGQRRELQKTITELESQVGGFDDARAGIRAEAAEMIGGSTVAVAEPNVHLEFSESKKRIRVLDEAIKMQQKILAEIKQPCIVEMVEERRPAQAAIVQRMDAALTALEDAITDDRSFRSQAVHDGLNVPGHIPMVPLPSNFGYQRGNSWEHFHQWRIKMTRVGYLNYSGRR